MGMARPLAGLIADVQENDLVNAKANFQLFKTEYGKVSRMVPEWKSFFPMAPVNDLGTALESDPERHYYIDKNIQDMIDRLEQALQANPVDAKQIEILAQGIGTESCFKCHLGHVPAAAAQ